MKLIIAGLILIFFLPAATLAQTQTLRGVYQGEDLFVKNPMASDGVGFSVYEVRINGEVTTDEVNSSAFPVDFDAHGIAEGEPVEVMIKCKGGCSAKVINPEAISPRAKCEFANLNLDNSGNLTWQTKNESGSIPFIVEQFRWNKWVEVGKVAGSDNRKLNKYSFLVPVHFGENKVRLKQEDRRGVHYSEPVMVKSEKSKPVSLKRKRVVDVIQFSDETFFEVFSEYGELITYGFDDEVFVKDVPRGKYYVNFGCQLAETVAKR